MLDATTMTAPTRRGRPPRKQDAAPGPAGEVLYALPSHSRFEELGERQKWLLTGVYCYGLTARTLCELKSDGGHSEQSVAGEIHAATLALLTAD